MHPIRVLLVDDESDLRTLVRLTLMTHGGFRIVAEAEDGHGAIALAHEHQPDLVVLDLGLPDLAGLDVLSQIRDLAPMSRIVVFTGAERSELKAQALAGGATEYLVKGDIDYLVELLEKVTRNGASVASIHLPVHPMSPRDARTFLQEHCAEWGATQSLEDALVVVSELVTNALTHASSACELRLEMSRQTLRIEVADQGPGTPDPRRADERDEHGRGLVIVSALSRAWGVQPETIGKAVWAELEMAGEQT